MNYGISILFRAIPLAMAVFCFGYGAFIYGYGDDGKPSGGRSCCIFTRYDMHCAVLYGSHYNPANHTYL